MDSRGSCLGKEVVIWSQLDWWMKWPVREREQLWLSPAHGNDFFLNSASTVIWPESLSLSQMQGSRKRNKVCAEEKHRHRVRGPGECYLQQGETVLDLPHVWSQWQGHTWIRVIQKGLEELLQPKHKDICRHTCILLYIITNQSLNQSTFHVTAFLHHTQPVLSRHSNS